MNFNFEKFLSSVPAGKSGKWAISKDVVPAGCEHVAVDMREAIMAGIKPMSFRVDRPVTQTFLKNSGGIVMSDRANESRQMIEASKGLSGNVLVGGLGLGMIAGFLDQKRSVEKVVVVEQSKDVIKLVEPYLGFSKKIEIVQADIFEFVKRPPRRKAFDAAFFDTWTGTNEGTWVDSVVPLRRSMAKQCQTIHCWAENIMLGQIVQSCRGAILLYAALKKIHPWHPFAVFINGLIGDGIAFPEVETKTEAGLAQFRYNYELPPHMQFYINLFCSHVGQPQWEKTWGGIWEK